VIEAAAELQSVFQRRLAMLQAVANALLEQAVDSPSLP
jgi:hypothetical protein